MIIPPPMGFYGSPDRDLDMISTHRLMMAQAKKSGRKRGSAKVIITDS